MEPSTQSQSKQDQKTTTGIKIKSFLLGIGAFLIVGMSLFHAAFDRWSKEYIEHKKEYTKIIADRNEVQDSLLIQLGKSLTIDEYKESRNLEWLASQEKLREFTKVNKRLKEEWSFLGRGSFKYWLGQFGIVLLGFYFSIKSVFDDINRDINTGHKFISIAGVSVCVFWFYHLFFQTANDFYSETYFYVALGVSVLTGCFIYGLTRYFVKKESLYTIIRGLFNFIFIESEKKGYIKDEKINEYKKRRLELAKNALDNE